MKIAVGQINPTIGDLAGNVVRILAAARQAAESSPDLIVFPEMALTGCHPQDILLDPGFIQAACAALEDLAEQTHCLPPMIIGTVLPAGEPGEKHPNLFNAAMLLNKGTATLAAAKRQLRNDDIHFEIRWFTPGPPPQLAEIGGQQLLVTFASDLDSVEIPPQTDLVVCLAADTFISGQPSTRLQIARDLGVPLVYANLIGGNDGLIFDGGSFALNRKGGLLAQLDYFSEQVKLVDMHADPLIETPLAEIELLFQALSLGIRDFADKNGIRQVFLGLSGGIDSAVAACLAANALGPERVTGVALPSRYTDPRSTQSAEELASNLGIGFEVVEIEELHTAAERSLAALLDEGLGAENLQARLRMIVLMAYVNRHGGMLLNTGNKTEAALGYATLYGDTSGTLCPIGDLTKPQVYQLAAWINRKQEVIPAFSIARPPSAELRPNQVDPFDYDDLSPKLETLVQANQSSPAMRAAEHKRAQMGVVLKVSRKAFGPGRMIPITRK